MILSHTHKFIFGRLRKVASSSTEIFLKDFLNPHVDVWHGEPGYVDEERYNGFGVGKTTKIHCTINNTLTPETQQYYKCVVERNPWDQYLSMIDFQDVRDYKHWSPKYFFNLNYNIYMRGKIYLHEGEPIVDKIMRYENLSDELNAFCKKFNLPFDKNKWDKMKYKSNVRKNKTHEFYKEHPDIKKQVEDAAWFHIEHLGYKF